MRLFDLDMDDWFGEWMYNALGMEQGCAWERIQDYELSCCRVPGFDFFVMVLVFGR
jgi:hypothetical protein